MLNNDLFNQLVESLSLFSKLFNTSEGKYAKNKPSEWKTPSILLWRHLSFTAEEQKHGGCICILIPSVRYISSARRHPSIPKHIYRQASGDIFNLDIVFDKCSVSFN